MMKKLLSFCLALLLCTAAIGGVTFPVTADTTLPVTAGTAEGAVTPAPYSYAPGLVAWYDGVQNTRAGADPSSAVWEDLISGYDLPVKTDQKNRFTGEGFLLDSTKNYFPSEICDLVNGTAFTVEILFGAFETLGQNFNTFMNSDNDNFALFRRVSNNNLEFKFAAVPAAERPCVGDGLNKLQNALITITYCVDGEVIIYINGVKAAAKDCHSAMGANNLFIGHVNDKAYKALYRSIRFYDRELSAGEVARNAAVDGYGEVKDLYVKDGLVSLYSGIRNTANGYDPAATVWTDLVSGYNVTVKTNEKNYFTREGFHLNTASNHFPKEIVDLVNGQEFTVEMYLGHLESLGSQFNTFINSSNDAFSLFRRLSNNVLEFKFAGNAPGERPTVSDGLEIFADSLISITYKVGDKTVIYVDGVRTAEVPAPKAMGADNLFFGHDNNTRNYDTTFRSLRFYNRALNDSEVAANAKAEGVFQKAPDENANPGFVTVAQPVTNIAGDVALVRRVDSAAELSSVMSDKVRPAAVILRVNKALEITDGAGKKIAALSEVMTTLDFTVIPVFELADQSAADALIAFLGDMRFSDCAFMSRDPALVKYARGKLPTARGVIDYTETYKDAAGLSTEQCIELRKSMKANMGTVALLPLSAARQSSVQYLYDSIVNVWVQAPDAPGAAEMYDALLSGAVGVVSDQTAGLYDAAQKLKKDTVTRIPLNIGHRGLPSGYPENTVEGSLAAFEAGADVIELDVYLTSDNQIVVMHDGTTGRTCNKDLPVESSTLAQLKELYVNKGFENDSKKNSWRIPTLEEFLVAFKDKDCRLFIEIKSGKANLVPIMKELIDKHDMYDQCAVITFVESQMANMRTYYPEMSVGALCSGFLDEINPDQDMKSVMSFIGKYNATLNPSYAGYGKTAMRAALIRGIGVYPWTFADKSHENYFLWGYSGLTGNTANVLGKMPKRFAVTGAVNGDTVTAGETLTLSAQTVSYGREENDVSSSAAVTILAGENLVSVDGTKLTFTGEGDVTFIVSYTYSRLKYTMYTQPVTVHVKAAETVPTETDQETDPETDPVAVTDTGAVDTAPVTDPASVTGATTSDGTETGGGKTPGGCKSAIGLGAVLCLLAASAVAFKKRKND